MAVFRHPHGPVALMNQGVVISAKNGTVGHAGRSTVDPELDVVQVGPAGGPVAAGEDASAVAEGDGAADAGGPDAGGAADVQGFAGGAEDGGDDVAVAQQPPGLGGADGDAGRVEGGGAEAVGEGVVLHGHGDVGSFPGLGGSVGGGEVPVQDGAQGVGEAGSGGSLVLDAVGFGAGPGVRVGGGDERGDGEVVEAAFDAGQPGAGVAGAEGEFGAVGRVVGFEVAVGVEGVDELAGDPTPRSVGSMSWA